MGPCLRRSAADIRVDRAGREHALPSGLLETSGAHSRNQPSGGVVMPQSSARRVVGALVVAVALVACRDSTGPRPPWLGPGPKPGPQPGAPAAADDPCLTDATPPTVSRVGTSRMRLWPANHRMHAVVVSLDATDACTAVTSAITSVTSSEAANGRGDGNTAEDWRVTGPLTVLLRAERSGTGRGRSYTINVRSADARGNATLSSTTVLVPHDNRP
jgi:hypothetical protein